MLDKKPGLPIIHPKGHKVDLSGSSHQTSSSIFYGSQFVHWFSVKGKQNEAIPQLFQNSSQMKGHVKSNPIPPPEPPNFRVALIESH